MSTVSELVSFQIAQTEQDLQSPEGLLNYAAIKASAIARAKAEFFGTTVPAESAMHEVVKYHLSDVAVIYLIDTAVDWYQSKTVAIQIEGNETLHFHDRVASLRAKRAELSGRISRSLDKVKAVAFGTADIGDLASLPLAQAQSEKRSKVTNDPWKWARYLYGDLVEVSKGFDPEVLTVNRP